LSECVAHLPRDCDPGGVEPTILLIPSPLLGPATWELTARVLERLGHRVRVPSLQGVSRGAPPYWPAGVDAIVESADGEAVVLVPHSNAGLLMPAVVDALGDQARGVVFVDAALPEAGFFAGRDFLNTLVEADGHLPPWTTWWDDADVAELFPDAEVRRRVEVEQPRLPLAYYDYPPPAPDGWDRVPCGYIWFAQPYGSGAERAAASGWPTSHVPGKHLHMVVDPDAVAGAILEMLPT
jgi:pimeloyl-ACP methyl ester carboxylesterase